jgi:PhzF family phenazine biosynthesis protein
MRQFETIFLRRIGDASRWRARIFTMEEELLFAGHPIIGAAVLVHAEQCAGGALVHHVFVTGDREVPVTSYRDAATYSAEMDQGVVTIEEPVPVVRHDQFLEALKLSRSDLAQGLPLQVVSTGLPYLIVPVRTRLEAAHIVVNDFESLLATVGARFVYVLDVENREGRTWDNCGRVEDIATGSAAGPAAAYLVVHGLATSGEKIIIRQGRFMSRPSELHARVRGESVLSVSVRGHVFLVGRGTLALPERSLHETI